MQRLDARTAARAIGVVADDHIDGHAIAVGVVNGHGCMLQTDVAMDQRHHRLAFDLGVAVRHGHGRLFVTGRQKLGHFVVAIVNERLMQRFVSRTGIGGQIFNVERLDYIHHVVGAWMFNHPRRFGWPAAGFTCQRHLRWLRGRAVGVVLDWLRTIRRHCRLLCVSKLGFRNERGSAGSCAF